VVKCHLWVLLQTLPFPLWSRDFLVGLANTLGRFVALEKDFPLLFYKRLAKVLVELDVSKGLLLEVEIDCGSLILLHRLYYLNIPFRSSYCHDTRNLRDKCSSLQHGRPLNLGFSDSDPSPNFHLDGASPNDSSVSPSPPDPSPNLHLEGDSPIHSLDPHSLSDPYNSSTIFSELSTVDLQVIQDLESGARSSSGL